MEICKVAERPSKKGGLGSRGFGLYEEYIFNEDNLSRLLGMIVGEYARVPIQELGSKARLTGACIQGVNRCIVAGELPLYTKGDGKGHIGIYRDSKYDGSRFATTENLVKRGSETDYEQPSPDQIGRNMRWLKEHGFVEEDTEEKETSE